MKMNKIEKLKQEALKILESISQEKKKQKVQCLHCEAKNPIGKLTLITSYYYVQPHGCTEGDYWTVGKDPEYYIDCLKCSKRSRYYHSSFEVDSVRSNMQKLINENSYEFADSEETHDGGKTITEKKEPDDIW